MEKKIKIRRKLTIQFDVYKEIEISEKDLIELNERLSDYDDIDDYEYELEVEINELISNDNYEYIDVIDYEKEVCDENIEIKKINLPTEIDIIRHNDIIYENVDEVYSLVGDEKEHKKILLKDFIRQNRINNILK